MKIAILTLGTRGDVQPYAVLGKFLKARGHEVVLATAKNFGSLPLPGFLNRFTYRLTDLGLKMWAKPIREFRQRAGLPERFSKPALPAIYGISEYLLKKPVDFPKNNHFTGFWMDGSHSQLSQELIDFISAGEPPLLVTFGSMPFDSRLDIAELITIVHRRLRIRVVVVKGWGLSDTSALEGHPGIKVIDSAPYDKLFPLVKAVVHHGGVGTVAACLRAGKPFLTCPVLYPLGDQFFWGKIAYEKGVALYPLPLKKLSVNKFIKSIEELIGNEILYTHAELFALHLSSEDGLTNAAEIIEGDGRT